MNFKRANQNVTRRGFLEELHRECALHFEPDVAIAVVMEVDAHLTESIQARLELGETSEIAEIGAVRSFHQPKRFVRQMGMVHRDEVEHDKPLFLFGLAFICWLAFAADLAIQFVAWYEWWLALLAFGIAMLVRSAQIGSLRRGTLKRLAIAAVIAIGIISPLRTINFWTHGGIGYMPVGMAKSLVANPERFILDQSRNYNLAGSWVVNLDQWTRDQVGPAKEALAAPFWRRYIDNLQVTMTTLVFSFGTILVTTLLPIAVRQRLRPRKALHPRRSV
ncbi:MAG: hypothetical protein P4L46_16280 [Fimbriimonas sp.]|nr:hypothetical protein [Fimbriimonas sp.]